MTGVKFILASVLLIIGFQEIYGHGYLLDPVNRSSAWRRGFNTPQNYNDNENFCGGFDVQESNGGLCGPCGDNYIDPQPRKNENGGIYGTGTIVETYKRGQHITAVVNITANHLGHFEFNVCPLNGPNDIETEECFNAHPVELVSGGYQYPVSANNGLFPVDLVLPRGLTCEHCTFRWHYRTGNTWGRCADGEDATGCGPQEQFRSCSDIAIQ